MRWYRRFGQRERGQTLIEFALIMPMVFLFLFVIVDFGIALDRRVVVEHAVREGARYGAVAAPAAGYPSPKQQIKNRTVAEAQNVIQSSDVKVCYVDPNSGAVRVNAADVQVGDAVDVCIKYCYNPTIVRPVLRGLFGGNIGQLDMRVTGSSRVEVKPTEGSDSGCPCPQSPCS